MASQPSLLRLSLVCYSEAVHSALSCLPGVTVLYIHIYLGLLMGGVSSGSPCAAAILHLPPFPVFDFAFRFPRGPVNVNEFVTAARFLLLLLYASGPLLRLCCQVGMAGNP